MDVEWAVDGITDQLFIVQARPETIHSRKDHGRLTEYVMQIPPGDPAIKRHCSGRSDRNRSGKDHVFTGQKTYRKAMNLDGDVLVTDMTDPDWEPIMKKASAIITNKGGQNLPCGHRCQGNGRAGDCWLQKCDENTYRWQRRNGKLR